MIFINNTYSLKKSNNINNLFILSLLLLLYYVKCDLLLRSPKDLQSQFISKKK